jgi:hypothetical protein
MSRSHVTLKQCSSWHLSAARSSTHIWYRPSRDERCPLRGVGILVSLIPPHRFPLWGLRVSQTMEPNEPQRAHVTEIRMGIRKSCKGRWQHKLSPRESAALQDADPTPRIWQIRVRAFGSRRGRTVSVSSCVSSQAVAIVRYRAQNREEGSKVLSHSAVPPP